MKDSRGSNVAEVKSFPTQSTREKIRAEKAKEKVEAQPTEKPTEKSVKGKATRKKKNKVRIFSEKILGDTVENTGHYIFWDVLVPGLRDTVVNMCINGVQNLFYGNGRGPQPYQTTRYGTNRYVGQTNYSYQSNTSPNARYYDSGNYAQRYIPSDDYIFDTAEEAEDLLSTMIGDIQRAGKIRVSSLNAMLNIEGNYTDNTVGWYNLSTARVRHMRDGFHLILPPVERIID